MVVGGTVVYVIVVGATVLRNDVVVFLWVSAMYENLECNLVSGATK
jgi:hypothetical protein